MINKIKEWYAKDTKKFYVYVACIIVGVIALVACSAAIASSISEASKCNHTYTVIKTVDPTCTNSGYVELVCTSCSDVSKTTREALGHSMKEISRVEPTCTNSGYAELVCTVCSSNLKKSLEALGHSMKEISRIEPTEESEGKVEYRCDRCNNETFEVLAQIKKCNLVVHIDFVPNLFFSTYDVNFSLGEVNYGLMEHGEDRDFSFTIVPGEYIITFTNNESSDVKGETSLTIDGDVEVTYKIYCYSDEIDVEIVKLDRLPELKDGEIRVVTSASKYIYKNYTEVEADLRRLGFTNIKYEILYDIIWGWTESGEVDSISIAGNKEFTAGDIFANDSEIVITYHMPQKDDPSYITMSKSSTSYDGMNYLEVQQEFRDLGFTNIKLGEVSTESNLHVDGEVILVEISGWSFDIGEVFRPDDQVYIKYYTVKESEPEASGPLYYSTNDYNTATKGNSGIFSYKSTGGSYTIYWIIDFEDGYVYYFTEGNGNDICDRLRIDSGTLNDKVTITYHDGGVVWSYYLHYKYVGHPETLIMVDQNGFDYKYIPTDLNTALAIRATKTIKDY